MIFQFKPRNLTDLNERWEAFDRLFLEDASEAQSLLYVIDGDFVDTEGEPVHIRNPRRAEPVQWSKGAERGDEVRIKLLEDDAIAVIPAARFFENKPTVMLVNGRDTMGLIDNDEFNWL